MSEVTEVNVVSVFYRLGRLMSICIQATCASIYGVHRFTGK